MSHLPYIMRRLDRGARVRIVLSRFGQETVELKFPWLPIRLRYVLPRDEITKIKSVLVDRSPGQRRAIVAL